MTLNRNTVLIWLSVISVLLLQTACIGSGDKNVKGSSGAKPDWVNGDAGFYPNSHYLSATGSASKAELAKDRALANLVKTFEVEVRENTTTRSDTKVSIRDGNESYSKDQRLDQQINLRTDKVVQGARVAETWFDKPVQTYHALAVLDRKQAGVNIQGEMARLDQETETELTRSRTQSDPLLSMAALNNALELQNQRLAMQQSLKVIDTRGRGKPAQWNLADLRGQLESQLQSLHIASSVDNDPLGSLDQAIRSAMGNAGFPAVNGSTAYTLVANLDVQDLGVLDGWYWLRAKLSIKLVEASGKIRGRQQWPLKVSAQQRSDAESRLMTQVSKTLNQELKDSIITFATGVN
ncbi:MAG: LPP20 family lipoprotein [Gammaproteobacteria bacterium]